MKYYTTLRKNTKIEKGIAENAITEKDLFNEDIDLNALLNAPPVKIEYRKNCIRMFTTTYEGSKSIEDIDIPTLNNFITFYEEQLKSLLKTEKIETKYTKFQIPKASGGLRTILAPDEDLKEIQSALKDILEKQLKMLPHDTSYAYCRTRSVKNAVEVHQKHKSRWFLKLDLKDFFTYCSEELIKEKIVKLYPICELPENIQERLVQLLCNAGLYENGLPQGTPLSPVITNLIMMEFDVAVSKMLYKQGYTYTRYADDLIISARESFEYKPLIEEVDTILKDLNYPFQIKQEKTRYGSSNGSNWNLGLMLNRDNQITIGHKNKKRIISMMYNLIKNPDKWSASEGQVLLGHLNWYKANEPQPFARTITWFNNKHNVDVMNILMSVIKHSVIF